MPSRKTAMMAEPAGGGLDLGPSIQRLSRMLAPIEEIFLSGGQGLSDAIALLTRLTLTFDALCDRLGGGEVREATRLLETTMAMVTADAATRTGHEAIGRLEALVGDVALHLAKLRAIMGEVSVLAINAKIEVSHIDGVGSDFTVFTREMGSLAATAGNDLDGMGHELHHLGQQVRSARMGREAFEGKQQAALAGVAERLGRSLGTVSQRQAAAAEMAGNIRDRSRRISEHVAAAVGALQVGDSTRQRIEHALYALDMAGKILDGTEGDGLSPKDRRAGAAAIVKLQTMQLSATARDYRHELERLLASLRQLASEAGEVRGQGIAAFGAASGGRTSFLTELRDDLAIAGDILRHAARAATDTREIMSRVLTEVGQIVRSTEAVHSIEADMRIMGLNAELKCGRLGNKGRALAVIAHELRARADLTAEQAGIAMSRLTDITTLAKMLGSTQDDAGLLENTATAELDAATTSLDAIAWSLAEALAQLDGDGERATQLLAEVARQLQTAEEFETGPGSPLAELEVVAATDVGDIDFRGLEDRVLRMRDRYTMASERDIHARFAGDAAALPACSEVLVDDMLF